MNSTNLSLLERLQSPSDENGESWRRFVDVYTPMLLQWAARLNVPANDRVDIVQETLAKLLVSIRQYRRESHSSFRSWLFTVLRNSWLDSLRVARNRSLRTLSPIDEPVVPDPAEEWSQQEYREYLLRRVHQLVLTDFAQTSQQAFRRNVIDDVPASTVAEELGLTVNAVYLVRRRVLQRIRDELSGLLE